MKKLLFVCLLLSGTLKSQVFVTPGAKLSTYDQAIGVNIGYKYKHVTASLGYYLGHQYKEHNLSVMYYITNNNAFNVGFIQQIGYINTKFHVWYPGLVQQLVLSDHCAIELGLVPSNYGLIILQPGFRYKF